MTPSHEGLDTSQDSNQFWEVAVNAPLEEPLTYQWNTSFGINCQPGMRVEVPLGKRKVRGTVIKSTGKPEGDFKIKSMTAIDEDQITLPSSEMQFLKWVSEYYMYPLGQVIEHAYPPLKRFSRIKKSQNTSILPETQDKPIHELTEEQKSIVDSIEKHDGFSVHLLHGVTGSGKTEIYLELIQKVLARGQSCLFLVPEISLTPQMIQRFVNRLGDNIAVLHSHLTDRERTNEWWKAFLGDKKIVIGARSALFCPLENLGLIVIDEEHETSFKQDEKLKYNGRDAAVVKGNTYKCPVILGSATPSMESYYNASIKKYHYHHLTKRVGKTELPDFHVIDLKKEQENRNEHVWNESVPFWMSQYLFGEIKETLERNEQVALFLNRRGTANTVVDPTSGDSPECPNCDISLTLHGQNHLVCHYCDYHETTQYAATRMKTEELKPIGLGTEKLESDLSELFPGATIARADRDEITKREELEDLIKNVYESKVDILIGTQMIAKGLDFPNLTLVGIVLADIGFNMPDFRACERSYQLLTQVGGRAGRHLVDRKGKVVIQALNTNHPSIEHTIQQSFQDFANYELTFREKLSYPPFSKMACFRISSLSNEKAKETAQRIRQLSENLKAKFENYKTINFLGPSNAPLARIRNQYRYQFILRASNHAELKAFCKQIQSTKAQWLPNGVKFLIDIDPQSLL